MKVLICEDEEIMLTALQYRLRKHGFEIVVAKDGKEALEMIQQDPPNVLIADIMMPYMSGLELVEYVRQNLKSTLPIIIISALEQDDTVLEAFRCGVNDFIVKPFKPIELILRIKKIFQEEEISPA